MEDKKALATVNDKYLEDNARVGLEDIGAEDLPTPSLNVVQPTSKAVDQDGRPFPRGKFLYGGDGRLLDEVYCTILSATTADLPDYTDKTKMVKTFILLGALEPDWKPFLLYQKKKGVPETRSFLGKIVNSGKPMYAQRVKLTAEKQKNDLGEFYIVKYTIEGLRKNPGEILMLESMAKEFGSKTRRQIREDAPEKVLSAEEEADASLVDDSNMPF